MECDPAPSVVLVNVATPLAFSVPLPRTAVPSRKVTVPVGVPMPAVAVTVAVNETAWPNTDGLGEETNTVVAAG